MASSYVPESIFELHDAIARDFISNYGRDVILVFLKRVQCDCAADSIGEKPGNHWVDGAHLPAHAFCQQCGGEGYRIDEITQTVKMAVYYAPKDWIKINSVLTLESTDGIIQTRSLIESIVLIEQCDYIVADANVAGYGPLKYKLKGRPVPHGIRGDNEVIALWQRI